MRGKGKKWVTRVELAALLDCHPRTIGSLIEEGLPVARKGKGGRPYLYDPQKCLAWKAARDEAAAAPGGLDPAQERALKDRAQRKLAEQMHEVRAGKLLDADEVAAVWGRHIAAVRARMLAVPTAEVDRLGRAMTLNGRDGLEKELKAVIYSVLRELEQLATSEAA